MAVHRFSSASRFFSADRRFLASTNLGRKRVIQVLSNMSVPRARVPEKASVLRDRSER